MNYLLGLVKPNGLNTPFGEYFVSFKIINVKYIDNYNNAPKKKKYPDGNHYWLQ